MLKGYVSRQYLCLYYNFAVGSFHTKNCVGCRLYSIKVEFLLYHDLTANFQTVLFPLLHHPLGILPSHIRTSSTYTLLLTRLKTHLFAESLLWRCDAVVFSLYFWRPRALDVGRHSKFMLIDWLIDTHPIYRSLESSWSTSICHNWTFSAISYG